MAILARHGDDRESPTGPKAPRCASAEKITDWLRLLYAGQEGVVGVTAVGVTRASIPGVEHVENTVSAPTDESFSRLAKYARDISARARAVYTSLNPVSLRAGDTWTNADILSRRWFLVDCDPTRPADCSATDDEKQNAKLVAVNVRRWLSETHGWSKPILADSGNGWHLLYRIDLPNDDFATQLVRESLKAIAARWATDEVSIDLKVYDARRVVKLYGTLARKGEHSADRPHRCSSIETIAAEIEVVSRQQLVDLVAIPGFAIVESSVKLPTQETKQTTQESNGNGHHKKGGIVAKAVDVVDAYAREAFDRELAELASAPVGDRNNRLFAAAAALCEFVNAGKLDGSEVAEALANTAAAIGLGENEIQTALRSARKKTANQARDTSHVGNGKPKALFIVDPETGAREKDDDPHRLARLFLKGRYDHTESPRIRFWLDEYHVWRETAWRVMGERELNAEITGFLKSEFDKLAVTHGADARKVGPVLIGSVAAAIRGYTLIPQHRVSEMPGWLVADPSSMPNPFTCLVTRNSLIDLPTLVAGGPTAPGAIRPPTPLYFSSTSLSYEFDPEPPTPTRWFQFLNELWPDDPESIQCLQQWFGYLLTPDTSQQKILMLIGPKRSGKGTIARVLKQLVGEANYASPTLSALGTHFGLQPLIGKTLAVVPESRLTGRADSQQIVERLLSISGEDYQSFDRKSIAYWHGRLRVRFVLSGNELPRLSDYSGAMASRLIVLKMTETFLGREDRSLEADLAGEISGILLWAIAGWQSLNKAGAFVQPKSGKQLMDEFETLSNPIGAFLAERCDVGPGLRIPVRDLYAAWKSWCEANGRDHPGDVQGFGAKLSAAVSSVTCKQVRDGSLKPRFYFGLSLKPGDPF